MIFCNQFQHRVTFVRQEHFFLVPKDAAVDDSKTFTDFSDAQTAHSEFKNFPVINGMKSSGKKRDNSGSIGKSFRRGCNSIAESATKKEGNQPSFFVGG